MSCSVPSWKTTRSCAGFARRAFVMSARCLLDKNPHPTRAEIVKACSGNLCRCGAQPHILAAIEKAARGEVGA